MRVQRVEKDTPYRTRKIFDKMPEGEESVALGALLIPVGCCQCLDDKNCGFGKSYSKCPKVRNLESKKGVSAVGKLLLEK